tara:strand:- start:95 stop:391 length:297 start_codon:yes stop_codon:yes gene_type:complete
MVCGELNKLSPITLMLTFPNTPSVSLGLHISSWLLISSSYTLDLLCSPLFINFGGAFITQPQLVTQNKVAGAKSTPILLLMLINLMREQVGSSLRNQA